MYRLPPPSLVAMLFSLMGAFSRAEAGGIAPDIARWTESSSQEVLANADPELATASGYGWKIPPPDNPDWKGLGRDTVYFLTYQFLIVGLLYLAPESVSGWTKENKADLRWDENAGDPSRDEDDHYVNYFLHPYWGASYYIRGRERGLDRTQSFLFSAGLSTLYEFGLEAFFENPSYQDLWTTPVLGSLIGEFVFSPIRDRIPAKAGELDWKDKTILFLTDPLGVVGAETDELLGVQTTLRLQAFQPGPNARSVPRFSSASYSPVDDALREEPANAWGVQVHVRW